MVDIPGNSGTRAAFEGLNGFLTVLGFTGELETRSDVDWVRLDVTAGVTYQIASEIDIRDGLSPGRVTLRNADGSLVATTSEANGLVRFTASATGALYVQAAVDARTLPGASYDIFVTSPARPVQQAPGGDFFGADQSYVNGTDVVDRILAGDRGFVFGGGAGDEIEVGSGFAHGGSGDDTLDAAGADGSTVLFGGSGDDDIQGTFFDGDRLYGNAGSDLIGGGSGDDLLAGGAGSDQLSGGADDDTLDGGAGADNLFGGIGDDLVYVDDAGDLIGDFADSGFDQVAARTSYSLYTLAGTEIELLTTTSASGTAAMRLTGDGFGQTIMGNDGTNSLYGLGGNDTLIGNGGRDYLSGGTGSDTASYAGAPAGVVASLANPSINKGDAAGDTYNSIENLLGSGRADVLNGNSGANLIDGGAGNDTLKGYGGADSLIGGPGDDAFVFNTALGASNVDLVAFYDPAEDTIWLDNSVFTALTTTGRLAASAFKNLGVAAVDASDRILYDPGAGALFYDRDGSGATAAIKFADVSLLVNAPVTNADFLVI